MSSPIRYLVFDIESVADAPLVAKLRYPGQSLAPAEAVSRYRAELLEKFESDFIPYTFQVPVSVAVGKVVPTFAWPTWSCWTSRSSVRMSSRSTSGGAGKCISGRPW